MTPGLLPEKGPPPKGWCLAPPGGLEVVVGGRDIGLPQSLSLGTGCTFSGMEPCADLLEPRPPVLPMTQETEARDDKLRHKTSSQAAE